MTFPIKILCADDNEWIGNLYMQIFAKVGYEVSSVTDGRAAWELLSNDLSAFDMVILDYTMPGLNGLEVAERLRKFGYIGRIIMQSGFLTPEIECVLVKIGVDCIIHKPIGFETIMSVVDELA